MFFKMRFDLGTFDSGERSLPFGLLVAILLQEYRIFVVVLFFFFVIPLEHTYILAKRSNLLLRFYQFSSKPYII